MKRWGLLMLCMLAGAVPVPGGELFVGLEGSTLPTKSSDLSGFPNVTWSTHFAFDVSGAAAKPNGDLFLCKGPFTTQLYRATLDGSPTLLCTIGVDIAALAYGRDTLYGYSNYATPNGIYAIDPQTGAATLVLDVNTGTGFRFFGLDYNPQDDLLYGYTEYGITGLYAIDIDSGEMTRLAGTIPASNGQGRGLAVGNNTVYLTATRGDDGIGHYAYDLTQGPGGSWVAFTNAYPAEHATGGAAWIPSPTAVGDAAVPAQRLLRGAWPNPLNPQTTLRVDFASAGPAELAVFTLAGRRVATLFAGLVHAGSREFVWGGCDEAGQAQPSGIYLVRAFADGRAESLKLVLLR